MLDYLRTIFSGRHVSREQRGASAVEYGLLIAGIAAVVVVAVVTLGPVVKSAFTDTCNAIDGAATTPAKTCK